MARIVNIKPGHFAAVKDGREVVRIFQSDQFQNHIASWIIEDLETHEIKLDDNMIRALNTALKLANKK